MLLKRIIIHTHNIFNIDELNIQFIHVLFNRFNKFSFGMCFAENLHVCSIYIAQHFIGTMASINMKKSVPNIVHIVLFEKRRNNTIFLECFGFSKISLLFL